LVQHQKNIICIYGPPSQTDYLKIKILSELMALNESISEERHLNQTISINTEKTIDETMLIPYVTKNIIEFHSKLLLCNTMHDVDVLHYDFSNFKNYIYAQINDVCIKTGQLIHKIRQSIDNIHTNPNLQKIIHTQIQETRHSDNKNIELINNQTQPNFKEKLKIAVIKKHFETDLLHISHCLINGDLEPLKNHFYFSENPECLKIYPPKENSLNKKMLHIFAKIHIKKIISNYDPLSDSDNIHQIFVTYLDTLMQTTFLKKTSNPFVDKKTAERTAYIRECIANIKKQRAEKDFLNKEKIRSNLKQYLRLNVH
jgi:hypothetical protein